MTWLLGLGEVDAIPNMTGKCMDAAGCLPVGCVASICQHDAFARFVAHPAFIRAPRYSRRCIVHFFATTR